MSTFAINGQTQTFTNDGSQQTGTINANYNPLNSTTNLVAARVINTSTSKIANVSILPTDYSEVYTFVPAPDTTRVVVEAQVTATVLYEFGDVNVQITVTSPGSGYHVGDVVVIPGNYLGGTSPTNDCTFTVLQVGALGELIELVYVQGLGKPVFPNASTFFPVLPAGEVIVNFTYGHPLSIARVYTVCDDGTVLVTPVLL